MLERQTIEFLRELSRNNNRDWFQEHRTRYQDTHQNFKSFIHQVRMELVKFDEIEKTKIYRIYRDLRFTKDKTPYKRHYAAHFTRKGKYRRGGLYFEISPDHALVAGGFWNPDRDDLQYIREGILTDAPALREVLAGKEIVNRFGGISGDELKTAPRGYDRDHPDIDLLRKKQFLLLRTYPEDEALAENFHQKVAADFEAMIPVFDVITDFLVYDGNGVERL